MKLSLFSRIFSRKSTPAEKVRSLSPEDIRRKLEGYRKTDGPAVFGGAVLYRVEEEAADSESLPTVESAQEKADLNQD